MRFFQQLTQRLNDDPAVSAAGAVSRLPFSDRNMSGGVTVETPQSRPGPWKGELARRHVTPGYFKAMGIRLLEGRFFDARDREDSEPVALIDTSLARRLWPTESPLGKRLHRGGPQTQRPWRTIVGVVEHVLHEGLDVQGREQVYFPLSQQPDDTQGMFIAVRPAAAAESVASLLRRTVHSMDPDLPMSSLMSMRERVSVSLSRPRLVVALLGLFALLGLSLAAMGIYGNISYSVERRRGEIGVRTALGAGANQVYGLVVGRAMRLTAAGLLLGLLGSLALGGVLSSLLFEIRPSDPVTLAGCVAFLGLVAIAAGSLPARRAARTDPMRTLRQA